MTPEDSKLVAEAVYDVDGGCVVCVSSVTSKLTRNFPAYDWAALIADAGWDNYGRGDGEQELRSRIEDEDE